MLFEAVSKPLALAYFDRTSLAKMVFVAYYAGRSSFSAKKRYSTYLRYGSNSQSDVTLFTKPTRQLIVAFYAN